MQALFADLILILFGGVVAMLLGLGVQLPQVEFPLSNDLWAGTPSAQASQILHSEFPFLVDIAEEVVIIRCESCSDVFQEDFARRSLQRLQAWANRTNTSQKGVIMNWTDQSTYVNSADYRFRGTSPYVSAQRKATAFSIKMQFHAANVIPELRHHLLKEARKKVEKAINKRNPDRSNSQVRGMISMEEHSAPGDVVFRAQAKIGNQTEITGMLNKLHALAAELDKEGRQDSAGPFSVVCTGPVTRFLDMQKSATADAVRGVFLFSIGLCLLGWHLQSMRFLLVPVLHIVTAVILSLSVINFFVGCGLQVLPLVHPVMMFWNVALSLDYSMFMLSRYVLERRQKAPAEEAVSTMEGTSGQVIVISGTVLMLCYLGSLCFPASGLKSIGMGAIVTIACNITVARLLQPALLTKLSDFFIVPESSGASDLWTRHATAVTSSRGRVIIPIAACSFMIAAVALGLPLYKQSAQGSLMEPRGGAARTAALEYFADFPWTRSDTTLMTVQAPSSEACSHCNIYSTCYFEKLNQLLGDVLTSIQVLPLNESVHRMSSIASLYPVPSQLAPHCAAGGDFCQEACCLTNATAEYLLHNASAQDAGQVYKGLHKMLLPTAGPPTHTLVLLSSPWDANQGVMQQFTFDLKARIQKTLEAGLAMQCPIEEVAVLNGATPWIDIADVTDRYFPYVVSSTAILAAVLVGSFFRSIAVPFRMLLTTALPILSVYGLTAAVYSFGLLHWMGIPSLDHFEGGMFCAVLAFTCNALLGLSLDYDIFLFQRVVELRFSGQSQEKAVQQALITTGPTITVAGLAMAVATGCMLFSDTSGSNQVGFALFTGVLLDTFVVRTCLVPSFLVLLGDTSYFPLIPPAVCMHERGKLDEPMLA